MGSVAGADAGAALVAVAVADHSNGSQTIEFAINAETDSNQIDTMKRMDLLDDSTVLVYDNFASNDWPPGIVWVLDIVEARVESIRFGVDRHFVVRSSPGAAVDIDNWFVAVAPDRNTH